MSKDLERRGRVVEGVLCEMPLHLRDTDRAQAPHTKCDEAVRHAFNQAQAAAANFGFGTRFGF